LSLYRRRRGGVWWVYLVPPHGGKRYRRSTGEREKARAQRIHDELKAELWKGQRGGTFHGALDAWVKDKGASDQYQVAKLKTLAGDQPVTALDLAALEEAIPQDTPATFNRYVNVLSAAGINGIKRRKVPKGRIRWLTGAEWKKLRRALPDHQKPLADFAIATGLRQANVFRLEWGQVDLKRHLAWIHPDQAKAGEPISVPLSEDALRILRGQIGQHGKWVFIGKSGGPPVEIKTGWAAAVRRAQIAPVRWHDLRHTWATWHIMAGTPLEVLQKLGGWSDLRMVMKYAHLARSFIDGYAGNAKPYQPHATNKATKHR
jgi:integrase